MPENRERSRRPPPRREFKARDNREGRSNYREKKEAQKVEHKDWVETYLKEMANAPVPEDWVRGAKYHLDHVSKDVKNIQVLKWKPLHADPEARIVDEASLWCSAMVDGKSYCVLLHLGPEVNYEWFLGTIKEHKAPF